MSKGRKFGNQANRGRRPFSNNFDRATQGLAIAFFPDAESAGPRTGTESVQERVTRLRAHLEVHGKDGDALNKYQELMDLPLGRTETSAAAVRSPEFLGSGGGQWGNPEVYIPGDERELRLSDDEWLILAQAAQEGVFIPEGIIPEKRE